MGLNYMIGSWALLAFGWEGVWAGPMALLPNCYRTDFGSKWYQQHKMAKAISLIFLLHFCTMGSGDRSPILLCNLRLEHSQERSITMTAVSACLTSETPQVSYAKQVVTCVGRDGSGSNILCPFPCFDEPEPSACLSTRSNDRLLCTGTSNARAQI